MDKGTYVKLHAHKLGFPAVQEARAQQEQQETEAAAAAAEASALPATVQEIGPSPLEAGSSKPLAKEEGPNGSEERIPTPGCT